MAETNGSLLLHNQTALHSLHAALDPRSMLLSQFSNSHKPQFLELTTESFIMERGPRFNEYSALRDKRLREKNLTEEQTPEKEVSEKLPNRSILTPPRKQVKFSSNFTTPPKRPKASSVLTQSVPDFSSTLRKENRKPVAALPPVGERSMTPPAGFSKNAKVYGKVGGGSKSTNSAEKRSGGLVARKSYANIDELKGLASAARSAITGENRGGRNGRATGKTVLGSRQF